MKHFEIILHNGQRVKLVADECTVKYNSLTGTLTDYAFENVEQKFDHPLFVKVSEIDAIVVRGD